MYELIFALNSKLYNLQKHVVHVGLETAFFHMILDLVVGWCIGFQIIRGQGMTIQGGITQSFFLEFQI
ncbi:hypothetical protein HanIR_Chr10g0474171 [Helianthus annuus]|nr:hypothetical protein HanIR_Chr10g0474171 [Helianthus annuus]